MEVCVYNDAFFDQEFAKALKYIFANAKEVIGRGLSDEYVALITEYANHMRKNYRIIVQITNRFASCFIRENTSLCRATKWENENRKRRLIRKYLVTREILRKLKKDVKVPYALRAVMGLVLDKMPRNSSWIRKKNRDIISGYPRTYVRKFGLSRHNIKHKYSLGEMPGLSSASW